MELKLGAFFRSSSSSEDDHLEGCTCDGDLDYNEASPRGDRLNLPLFCKSILSVRFLLYMVRIKYTVKEGWWRAGALFLRLLAGSCFSHGWSTFVHVWVRVHHRRQIRQEGLEEDRLWALRRCNGQTRIYINRDTHTQYIFKDSAYWNRDVSRRRTRSTWWWRTWLTWYSEASDFSVDSYLLVSR